jgi:predicted transcriptional regulator
MLKISDPATAFRLPQTILATVDAICAREDLTRSQVFRRSVMQYLKSQNATITDVNAPKPQEEWFAEWNQGGHRESPSQ